jgi:hypothetical protein
MEAFNPDVKSWEVFRAGEGDDGAKGRYGDLTRTMTGPEGGLAPNADDDRAGGRSCDLTKMTMEPEGGRAT